MKRYFWCNFANILFYPVMTYVVLRVKVGCGSGMYTKVRSMLHGYKQVKDNKCTA